MSSAAAGAAPTLISLRDQLRIDLHDQDATAYKWQDATLERHISRAVAEYSHAHPDPQTTTLTSTPASRDLSVTSLTDLVRVDAVEWPINNYPRSWAAFQLWGSTLTLLVPAAPSGAESVRVYWGKVHTATSASTTLPPRDLHLILTGAAGYAAQEWATYATNRVNVDQQAVDRYAQLAKTNLAHFHSELARRPRPAQLGRRSLTAPQEAIARGDGVEGP